MEVLSMTNLLVQFSCYKSKNLCVVKIFKKFTPRNLKQQNGWSIIQVRVSVKNENRYT